MALISYQRNPYTREWNLKLCNMSILKSRSNFEKQKGVLYFIGIPVFFYGLKDKMVRKYSESIFKLFPDHDLYICSYSGAGEVFQLALRLPSFIKKSQKRNPCVICTNNKLVQIFEMVLGKKIPIYLLPDYRCQFIDKPFECDGKIIYVPLNRLYFTTVERNIISNRAHYFDSLLPHLNAVSKDKKYLTPVVSRKVRTIRQEFAKIAFLSPEADTINELPLEYWRTIVTNLKGQGYRVYLNALKPEYKSLDVVLTCELSYREALELCSQSDLLIGLRSGFVELALFLKSPKSIIIYNQFRDTCVTKLSSRQALEGFTLKKLPIRNSNNVVEVCYSDYRDATLLLKLVNEMF